MRNIKISETLIIDIYTGNIHADIDPHVWIIRKDAGLVSIRLEEIRHLVDALTLAAAELERSIADEDLDGELG